MRILITGGCGFIGSHLVHHFLNHPDISLVRVLDNLSTGVRSNIPSSHPKLEFIEGDIMDLRTCIESTQGINRVLHQAALGSVPRSIDDPIPSAEVNIMGSVNLLTACVEQRVDRVIHAFSSSTYGDNTYLPKKEPLIGKPLNPYAVTKHCNEQFADVFSRVYGLDYIGLRYFNVFGERQNPNGAYAAVIPKFIKAALIGEKIFINGDGTTSRDFTYVDNVVYANELALFANQAAVNQVYNIACGESNSLNRLVEVIESCIEKKLIVEYVEERKGDIKHSLADITKAGIYLNYKPNVNFTEGISRLINKLNQ